MKIKAYREHGSILKLGNFNSVIQNPDYLIPTLPASNGYYLFSETSTGKKPLILIGKFPELIDFFTNPKALGIENTIKSDRGIYLGCLIYVPGKIFPRFSPLKDYILGLAENFVKILGLSGIGAIQDGMDLIKDISHVLKNINKNKAVKENSSDMLNAMLNEEIYMRFHYLKGAGMDKIAQDKVEFKDLAIKIEKLWKEPFK